MHSRRHIAKEFQRTDKRGRISKLPGLPEVSMGKFAAAVGISVGYLSRIVAGKVKPSMDVGMKIAETWRAISGENVTLEELIREFQNQEPAAD